MFCNKKTIWKVLTTVKEDILSNTTIRILTAVAFVIGGQRAYADFTFGEPANLGPTVNSPSWDGSANLSADGLELYFTSKRFGGLGSEDIWVTKRKTVNDPWAEPVNLGSPINTSDWDGSSYISANGL